MATPTQGKPAAPPQVVATPPVSTPFSTSNHHLAFSPKGPRSVVPSPQQFKKSPANSNTLYGYPSGGGHPTNSSFGAGYDSPTAAMALGGVPDLAQLGLDGMGTQGLGALGNLGRGDEDEQKRRLQHMLDILQVNKGKLSEAGIDRLAQRTGLATQWMTVSRTQKSLDIAASLMVLNITFSVVPLTKRFEVEEVALALSSSDIVERHAEKAGNILLQDLRIEPHESPLTKSLDKFAANLERLAALDKLSVTPGLNCYEAIAGIYESIEKLHKWEVARLKEQDNMAGKSEAYISRTALCRKSGRPVMHARGRLGMGLDYWQERHCIQKEDSKEDSRKTWALMVECASPPGLVYTPARVSEKWISDEIQKTDLPAEDLFLEATGHTPLDWLEPENTLLPSTDTGKSDAMDLDAAPDQKHPEVVFCAKFDPPLIVPYAVAMQIHNQINTPIDMYEQSTFDGLAFPHGPGDKTEPGEARTIKTTSKVPVYSEAGKKLHTHNNTLFIEKIEYGRILTELPFSHPRQLVEMLPTLRQYAFLHSLLEKSFGASTEPAALVPDKKDMSKSMKDKFAEFMAQSSFSNDDELSLDITLTTSSVPRLQVVFPFKNRTANITFDIKQDAVVEVVSQNILKGDQKMHGKALTMADLGRMLEVCEDLGIWAEFVRKSLG
ncbi:hypothetical protein BP6252_03151 [Coleophoma cylindrospora]|uniref:Mediator of RNA polymerase II transcription subunit 1 n=1 Tax=Coleophoma cylindrospora TaxID=1849047 RepID=A0A3D8S6X7_9HELO|nr:hypothetical protein BP6252_03151 [Coleophoma cylindrospora]